MKKIFVLILAFCLLISGCVSTDPEIDPNLVVMEVTSSSESKVSFVIKNNSKDAVVFGESYTLEFFDGESWSEVPEAYATFFIEIAHLLASGEEYKSSVNLEMRYGALSSGTYRIVKSISLENDLGETYATQQLTAEFEIFAVERTAKIDFVPEIIEPEEPAEEDKSMTVPTENQTEFVFRANAKSNGGEEIIRSFAMNENSTKEKPAIVFYDAETFLKFMNAIAPVYQIGEGAGSLKEKFATYDEEFFKENVLLLTHIRSGSGSARYSVKSVDVFGEKCTMTITVTAPQVGTADMADWFVFAERPKAEFENINSFSVKIIPG